MLNTLLESIKTREILNSSLFESINFDEVLDQRDDDPFDSNWIKSYNEIETEMIVNSVSLEDQKTIEEIRKESFFVVSGATNQHEIASYISDDFDLIAKSLAVNSNNQFASELLKSYRNGVIPH